MLWPYLKLWGGSEFLAAQGRLFPLWTSVVREFTYTLPEKCCHVWLDQNFDPSLLTNKLWLVFKGMEKKKFKMADSKKLRFSKPPIPNIFFKIFMDWSLG
jgi:hypothetical protein